MEGDQPAKGPSRIAINRVYTRKGDCGSTRLVGGQQVSKVDLRVEAYGTIDELSSFVGAARQSLMEAIHETVSLAPMLAVIRRIQNQLFDLGSTLATLPEDLTPGQPEVTAEDVKWLEWEIDRLNEDLPSLRSFVLPGGSRLNTELNICRTVCRRAERVCTRLQLESSESSQIIPYLNRLSDALFVMSRWSINQQGLKEELWEF